MLNFRVHGNTTSAEVSKAGELYTIQAPYPTLESQKTQPFRQYLTTDGTEDGTNDMGVDGSATAVDYYIPASGTDDIYITSLNFIVGYGTTGQPFQWADGTALTNGSRLFYTSLRGEQNIHNAIKSNQDMFRLSFSPVQTSWELRGINALNDYGYFLSVDLTKMGTRYGIKLDRKTTQRLTMRIRDNAGTAADSFNCIAYGFKRFE